MVRKEVIFFPPSGENYSPWDYLMELEVNEQDAIWKKLNALCQLERKDWPWVKPVQGLIQLTQGDHRIYLYYDRYTIVVFYACRKQSQKTKRKDIYQAKANLRKYLNQYH